MRSHTLALLRISKDVMHGHLKYSTATDLGSRCLCASGLVFGGEACPLQTLPDDRLQRLSSQLCCIYLSLICHTRATLRFHGSLRMA